MERGRVSLDGQAAKANKLVILLAKVFYPLQVVIVNADRFQRTQVYSYSHAAACITLVGSARESTP